PRCSQAPGPEGPRHRRVDRRLVQGRRGRALAADRRDAQGADCGGSVGTAEMVTITDAPSSVSAWRTAVAYALMLAAAAGVFFAIRAAGEAIPHASAVTSVSIAAPGVVSNSRSLLQLLIALAAVIVTG